jgi:capsule polysaccharide export protein KpsE/RkpR
MEDQKTKSQEPSGAAFEACQDDPNAEEQTAAREIWIATLRLLWSQRSFVMRVVGVGLVLSAVLAFVIPKRYTMPPDPQSTSSMMMLAGMAEKAGSGLSSMAGDLLALKSSGALFVGMLQSQTIQDHLVQRFELKTVYRVKLLEDARKVLTQDTDVQEDRKSGIITIAVTDRSPQRAAAIANSYVNELNAMVAQLSTSSAHRERVFLEERLQSVKRDLDDAETQLAQFSSKNNTIDIQQQEKAMLEATSTLAGQLIAAQSELEGLRQIYTDDNARVRSSNARIGELRKELDKLSGQSGTSQTGNAWSPALTAADPAPVSSANMPYPSTRNLPLLGVKYADYYRHTKIQETVYELLTEQNELAKVEEAKETPSVKVLDPAEIPETRSYPRRRIIVFLGMLMALIFATVQVIGTSHWQQMGPEDERKIFAREVATTMRAQMQWLPQNAASLCTKTQGIFNRLRRPAEGGAD